MSLTGLNSLKAHSIKISIISSFLLLFLLMQGCSDIHSRIWNRAEAVIDGHRIVISPCRGSYTKTTSDTPSKREHLFACSDDTVKVQINNEELTINDKSYGALKRGDNVIVKNGRVFINEKEAGSVAMK